VAWALAAAVLLAHLATSAGYGYFRDELYYLACSAHPALGYVDFPPLLALGLGAWRAAFGDSLLALRFLPALAAAATVLITAAIVRALGGDRRALLPALVPVMLAPIYVGTFSILTPNALDVVVWTALLLVAVRLLAAPSTRGWVAFGVLVAVGFWNRHGIVFLAIGLAVGLVLTPERRLLRTRGPWIAVAIAAALILPHLAWQAAHGWPTLEFLANARRDKMIAQSPFAFLGEQVLVLIPLAAPLWIAGLVSLWRREGGRYRALAVAWLTIVVLMIPGSGKAYYLTPFYPLLFAAGAVAFVRAGRTALSFGLTAAVALLGLTLTPLAKPLLPEERFVAYAAALGQDPRAGIGERHELGVLPQHFADQHGWPALAATVARVLSGLPPAERTRACVLTANYGQAGAIDFFGPALGLPAARSGHNSYWLWGPGDCDFETVVTVGFPTEDVRPFVRTVEEAARVECAYCMPHERRPVLIARGPAIDRDALWARLKRFQ
jgi:hypothetical protein